MIAGARRGASGLGRSGSSVLDDEIGANGISDDRLAARAGTLPRAGSSGGGAAAPGRIIRASRSRSRRPSSRSRIRAACCCRFRSRAASIPSRAAARPRRTGWWSTATPSSSPIRPSTRCLPRATSTARRARIAFEIQPHWDGSDETNNSLLQIRDEHEWANNLQIVKNLNSLRFIIIDSSRRRDRRQRVHRRLAGRPAAPVTATWGEAQMTLYVDGQQVGADDAAQLRRRSSDTTPIHVGSDFPGSITAAPTAASATSRSTAAPSTPARSTERRGAATVRGGGWRGDCARASRPQAPR